MCLERKSIQRPSLVQQSLLRFAPKAIAPTARNWFCIQRTQMVRLPIRVLICIASQRYRLLKKNSFVCFVCLLLLFSLVLGFFLVFFFFDLGSDSIRKNPTEAKINTRICCCSGKTKNSLQRTAMHLSLIHI